MLLKMWHEIHYASLSQEIWTDQAIAGPNLSNGWSCGRHVIVRVLTLTQHWSNTKDSTVEVLLLAQR